MKKIGYWRNSEDEKSDLPYPCKSSLNKDLQEKVIKFLMQGVKTRSYKGWSSCRICGKSNGSSDMRNGEFEYPEGYVHYIQDHNIQPDENLIKHLSN